MLTPSIPVLLEGGEEAIVSALLMSRKWMSLVMVTPIPLLEGGSMIGKVAMVSPLLILRSGRLWS